MQLTGTILNSDGVNIDGIEDALFYRFLTNFQDGVIKGAYEEASFSLLNSNTLRIGKGEILISGMRVIIEANTQSFAVFPKVSTRYQIILQIQIDELGQPKFSAIMREIQALVKQDILNRALINAVYQVELGRFSLNQDGIEDITKTLDTIVAGKDTTNQEINIGNVTANKIDISLQPEVDIENRFDTDSQKYFVDFNFQLPVDLQKETIDKIDLSLSNSQTALEQANSATQAVNELGGIKSDFIQIQELFQTMQQEIETLRQNSFITSKEQWLDLTYPVGSYYQTTLPPKSEKSEVKTFDPNEEWGGVWKCLPADAVLWSVGENGKISVSKTTEGYEMPTRLLQSLPNITGSFVIWNSPEDTYVGAFGNETYMHTMGYPSGSGARRRNIQFDASIVNSTYGRSSIVRPPAYGAYIWLRVA